MTDDWKSLFARGRVIPPHSQTVRKAQDSCLSHPQGFQITLNHVDVPHIQQEKMEGESEGSQKREAAKYQLNVSLFDSSHQHFFGRTWKSLPQQMMAVHRVVFNEVLYFHTSLCLPSVVAVAELVVLQARADGSQRELGCGFAVLHLFSSRTESQTSEEDKRLCFYHGTPRALLHPLLRDCITQNKLLVPIIETHLVCRLKPHPALAPVIHLFPQNMLVSGDENIPGIRPSPTGDSLFKPHMVKSLTCFLDRLSISLHPSLEKFESQLLQLINMDCHNTKHWGPEGSSSVVIQERRLHVGAHNGWGFLERPQVVVLETAEVTSQQGTLTKDNFCPSQSLALRSSLELKLPSHQAVGIVLQLEYVFSAPLGNDGKISLTSTSPRTAFMQCLRWGVWCPFQEWGTLRAKEVKLSLQGGTEPNPYGVMAYTSSSNIANPAQVGDERDVVRFCLSSRSLQKVVSSPALSLRKTRTGLQEIAAQQGNTSSLSPGPSRCAPQASPTGSPQGPGLSMSQLAATSRYPTMSHSTAASPWQQPFPCQLYPSPLASAHQLSHVECPAVSHIAHLEVGSSGDGSLGDGLSGSALACDGPSELQELAFTPVHAPVITMGMQATTKSSSMSSRGSLAHLYSAGFPNITDLSGMVAEVLDPTEPVNFDPQKEEADPLQGNVLLLQFLAFSRIPQQGVRSEWPDSVHFTFQLYRFPPVTTQRLKLLAADKQLKKSSETPPCVLAVINQDGTVNSGSPGLQLQFCVDGAFLKPGERRWFLRYLAHHTLLVDVWDSNSLLLIGSTALELKQHMLRQGRPAVQATYELEVITTEYMGEGVQLSLHQAPTPISVFTTVKGRLHLRLGNVGCPVNLNHPNKLQCVQLAHIISPQETSSGFTGGSLSSKSIQQLNVCNMARAQRLVELDRDLVTLLQSRVKEDRGTARTNTPNWGKMDNERQRKLNRMVAVRQQEGGQDSTDRQVKTKAMGRREERAQLARDLRLMQAYRERSKAEGITHMLCQAITTHHTLFASLGTAEYLEYVLQNPFSTPQTVTIQSDDPELNVITDCDEWRHFRALTKTLTPLEEDMFHLREGTLTPQVYLRPKESVHIPFKYQTFVSDHSVAPQGPSLIPSGRSSHVAKKRLPNTVLAKSIKVTFSAEDGKPLAICQVNVEPMPHAIDQTFRFYQPELSFLKKALRLPPWERTQGTDAGSQISVRCSDPNVICETKKLAAGEPQDVYLKVPGSPSPHIRKFFVTVYNDKWLAVPAQIWQVYVHFLHRVDISCVTGQRTCQSLVLRGTQAMRKVQCYTSHPEELKVDPAEVFVLPPGTVQDLQLYVCPLWAGSHYCYLNVVDVEQHTLVASWLLSLTCRLPVLSKTFEVCAPVGGGRGSTRKITYTNPYPTSRVLLLHSDHPDLLQFKEDRFEIGGGETYSIGLRFAPSQSPGAQEILIYVNNIDETTEETFCVKVKYT
ncbi:nephrocystin-4 isoform X2 [Esox lucius]|uniref:nephrocystin-4 isoform X2 n=1 Tax=Esox lucius TaxID=8010 RepID=UPI001476E732|nr:nephrocystin-4 isoform X2 [Esox lucius]